jgi:hypothetical protein
VKTRIRDLAGLKIPSFSYEQAISHCRHPVHFRGSILSDRCMGPPVGAVIEILVIW